MIGDYAVYTLSGKEKALFYGAGYTCFFAVIWLFYHSLLPAIFAGVLVIFFRPYAERALAERRRRRLEIQFKDLLYSLSSSVAAGRQMGEAIVEACDELSILYEETDPIMVELRHMRISMQENKESDKVLLQDFARRSRSEDIHNFVQVYTISRSMGGDLDKIIGHTAQVITDKMSIEKEIHVRTNQKRIEGRLIALMPFAMLLVMNLFSYSYIEPLYTTWRGRLVMTGTLAVIAAGVWIMEKLARIEV